ncbi:hypothetical protein [Geodermatophilus sp. DSM 45219]|uniref:hypothetical protein n=1 Tax=Geodermatophilus sp. DSM 45219 TaxID=1881103 RepID=UPI0008819665|nr:hypothetical protein [Geodermatophilus sp. DSM 45219]SDO32717.1 hypothetical protein SAMN05428965_3553 [Geodermatophilus sp. DSM 45219]
MTRPAPSSRLLPTAAAVAATLALAACSGGGDAADAGATAATAPPPAGAVAGTPAAGTTPGAGVPSQPADPSGAADAEEAATDAPRPATTDVVLSLAAWEAGSVVAAGYVSPVVEDGGTCVLELTRGGETRTATAAGLADASTTACGDLQVSGEELAAGTWTAVLRYESDAASGESDPVDVEVPA